MRILGVNAYAHDAGIAFLEDGKPAFVLEEERFNRIKKTTAFPSEAISFLRQQLNLRRSFEEVTRPKVHYVGHHVAHACNAFFLSPFDRAAVLVMDAYGDECSTSFYHATGTKVRTVAKNRFFDSLGIVYSMVTKYLGFRTVHDEGTVMALAAHGRDAVYPEFRKLVTLLPDGRYTVDSQFFDYHRYGEIRPVSRRFLARFGPPRGPTRSIRSSTCATSSTV